MHHICQYVPLFSTFNLLKVWGSEDLSILQGKYIRLRSNAISVSQQSLHICTGKSNLLLPPQLTKSQSTPKTCMTLWCHRRLNYYCYWTPWWETERDQISARWLLWRRLECAGAGARHGLQWDLEYPWSTSFLRTQPTGASLPAWPCCTALERNQGTIAIASETKISLGLSRPQTTPRGKRVVIFVYTKN